MSFSIHQGDALAVLRTLPDSSVHCTITSPPYWGLRDYGTASWEGGNAECDHKQGRSGSGRADGIVDERSQRNRDGVGAMGGDCGKCGARRVDQQIGLESTPAEYVSKMVAVFREVRRVLRNDGTLWLNLGDSYNAHPGQRTVHDKAGTKQLTKVLTLDGAFKNAAVIVASPPCQAYSYMAMPWTRAKALAAWYRDPEAATERIAQLTALFDACFRLQREASEATRICDHCAGIGSASMLLDGVLRHRDAKSCPACFGTGRVEGRHIPLVVENVKGAEAWVGRANAQFGSFLLWGDVRRIGNRIVGNVPVQFGMASIQAQSRIQKMGRAPKAPNGVTRRLTNPAEWKDGDKTGLKRPGNQISAGFNNWPKDERFSDPTSTCRRHGSRSKARKAASAQIAKIPFPLASHIARIYKPRERSTA